MTSRLVTALRSYVVGTLFVLMFAACSGEGPPSGPTSVFLAIQSASPVVPDELRLSVTGDAGALIVDGARLPETGPLVPVGGTLLGTVTVYLDSGSGELLLEVVGHVEGVVMSRGITSVNVVAGRQVSAEVTLQPLVGEPDAGIGDAAIDAGADLDTGAMVDAGLAAWQRATL